MQLTNQFIQNELSKAQALLWSGSIDEADKAHNIVATLLADLQKNS